jgi:hypothetical protein
MLALKHHQLALVTMAAGTLPPEKRPVFLDRLAARLRLHGRRFTDDDLVIAMQAALYGLIQGSVAPASQE